MEKLGEIIGNLTTWSEKNIVDPIAKMSQPFLKYIENNISKPYVKNFDRPIERAFDELTEPFHKTLLKPIKASAKEIGQQLLDEFKYIEKKVTNIETVKNFDNGFKKGVIKGH